MNIAGARADTGRHDLGKLMRRRNRRNDARIDDGTCDRARMSLVTQGEDDTGEIALAGCVDDISRARTFATHAHIERSVVTEREAARSAIKLHRGDAKIEHDAVDCIVSRVARYGVKIGKAVFDQGQAAARLLDQVRTQRDRSLIAVDAADLAVGGGKNGARIAAGAEGAVDIDAAVAHIKETDRVAAEPRSGESRAAGRHQFP